MIRTENLTKKYKNVVALENLNLTIAEKEISARARPPRFAFSPAY